MVRAHETVIVVFLITLRVVWLLNAHMNNPTNASLLSRQNCLLDFPPEGAKKVKAYIISELKAILVKRAKIRNCIQKMYILSVSSFSALMLPTPINTFLK